MEDHIRRITVCICIVISCTSLIVDATNMHDCVVSPHPENNTLGLYIDSDGNDHDGVMIEFYGDLRDITLIDDCDNIVAPIRPKETCILAVDSKSFEITYEITDQGIVVKMGNLYFPSGGYSYASGTIRVTMKLGPNNPGDYGDTENCTAFTTPSYSSDILVSSTSTLGSVQTLTFSESVPIAIVTCSDVLEDASQAAIGTEALCTRSSNTTMKIFYGPNYSPGAQTLQVKGTGFGAGSTFTRAILPTFTLTGTTTADKYQDFANTWTVTPTGSGNLNYQWIYASGTDGPALPGNATSFVFKYWEAKVGETYQLNVTQTDENNSEFSYRVQGAGFTVLSSCSYPTNCSQILWTLSNDPGTVPTDCTNSSNLTSCTKSGPGPFVIKCTYTAGSIGDEAHKLDHTLFANAVSSYFDDFADAITCGSSRVFPSLALGTDAASTQSATSSFSMIGTLTDRALTIDIDYSLGWTATSGGGTGFCTTDSTSPTCTISAGSLSAGTYQYTLKVFLDCASSVVWDTLVFTQFDYTVITATESTLGSVQTLTFSESISTASFSGCSDALVDISQAKIGSGALCTRPTDLTLKIFYGRDYTPGADTLQLKGSYGTSTFTRAILPTFTLTGTATADKYEDFANTWSVTPTGSGSLIYEWEYESGTNGPALPTENATSFVFNYWEAKAGETYNLRVTQLDESNNEFFYQVIGDAFKVLSSCSTPGNCQEVAWTLNYNPGSVPTDCTDSPTLASCSKSGSGPYTITSTYIYRSLGGTPHRLNHTLFATPGLHFLQFANAITCGGSLVFPSLALGTDAASTQSATSSFSMIGTVTDRGLTMGADYSLQWTATGGGGTGTCTTDSTSPTCTISAGSLSAGTYQYTLKVLLDCAASAVWNNVTFTQFEYTVITETTLGSIQTLTFPESISTASFSGCSDVLVDISQAKIGTGALCTRPTDLTLKIFYGKDYTAGADNLQLKGSYGTSTFTRAILPTFTLTGTTTVDKYQDFANTWTVTPTGTGSLSYQWSYGAGIDGPTLPTGNVISFVFKYWEAKAGETYRLNVTQTDENNSEFSYKVEGATFTVLSSCVYTGNCGQIKWTISNDPGTVSTDCTNSSNLTSCTKSGGGPYYIKCMYTAGSIGGETHKLDHTLFTDAVSPYFDDFADAITCGSSRVFPSLAIGTDAASTQSATSSFSMIGTVTDRGLVLDTDFCLQWTATGGGGTGSCTTDSTSPTCTISAGSLSAGTYQYTLKVILYCSSSTVWDTLVFTQFDYTVITATESTLGSVQTVTFSESISTASIACSDALVDISQAKIGSVALCTRPTDLTLKIFYGIDYTPGADTLQLKGSYGTSTFTRAILPTFTLTGTTTADKYQDFANTWTVTPTGSGNLNYQWIYASGTDGPALPGNATSFVFKYWEAKVGETYQLNVTQSDDNNNHFSYTVQGANFKVLSSCSTPGNCRQVVWTLSYDPGSVGLDCTDNSNLGNCVKAGAGPYTITSTYAAGSTGGTSIKLDHSKFTSPSSGDFPNFATNISCGSSLVFPSLSKDVDAGKTQSSETAFNISGRVNEQGFTNPTDYTLSWDGTNSGNICSASSITPKCTFPSNSLTYGNSYTYTLKLFLICANSDWNSLSFTQFTYLDFATPILPSRVIPGTVEVDPSSGIACQTQFNIIAKDWKDSWEANSQLSFRFGYEIKHQKLRYLSDWDTSNQWTGLLPYGGKSDPVKLFIFSKNNNDSRAELSEEIFIVQPKFSNDEEKSTFINNLITEGEKGKPKERLNSILRVKSFLVEDEELEDKENHCGGCGHHGSCDSQQRKCVCQGGWKANKKCIISDQNALRLGHSTKKLAQSFASIQDSEEVKGEEGVSASVAILGSLAKNAIYMQDTKIVHELTENILKNAKSITNKESKLSEEIKTGSSQAISDLFKPKETKTTDSETINEETNSTVNLLHNFNNIILSSQSPGEEEHIETEMFELAISRHNMKDFKGTLLSTKNNLSIYFPYTVFDNEIVKIDFGITMISYGKSPLLGHSCQNSELGPVLEINIFKGDSNTSYTPQTNGNNSEPYSLKLRVDKVTKSPPICSFYDQKLNNYSAVGLETDQNRLEINGTGTLLCKSTHLSTFVPSDNPYTEISSVLQAGNYQAATNTNKLTDYDPLSNSIFWLCVSLAIFFVVLIVLSCFCCDVYRTPRENKYITEDLPIVSQEEHLQHPKPYYSANDFPTISELDITNNPLNESELVKEDIGYFSYLDRRKGTTEEIAPKDQPKISRETSINNDQNNIEVANFSPTLTNTLVNPEEKEEEKTEQKWYLRLGVTFIAFHSALTPFDSDKRNRVRRSTKILVFYCEILLLFMVSGLFFNTETGENNADNMSYFTQIIFSFLVALISLPLVLIPAQLMTRSNTDPENSLRMTTKEKVKYAIGLIVALVILIVANLMINILAATFGDKLATVWIQCFLFSVLEDFFILQIVKCLVIFCCSSQGTIILFLECCFGSGT